jgi:hypothetical protein
MTKAEEATRSSDPFELWRQLYDVNERAWSAALEQAMGTSEFGESSGKLLETMLAAQKSVRDNMRTYLETMNVPTREDIARLGELVVGLEEKIDQVGDRLDALDRAVGDNMRTHLETMTAPTREGIARLGELLVGLERKIDRRHALEDAARAKAAASAKAASARSAAKAQAARAAAKAKAKAVAAAKAQATKAKAASVAAAKAQAATAKAARTQVATAKSTGPTGTSATEPR